MSMSRLAKPIRKLRRTPGRTLWRASRLGEAVSLEAKMTQIKLRNSEESMLVSEQDAQFMDFHKWSLFEGYVYRYVGSKKCRRRVWAHRVIMERMLGRPLHDKERPDHINGNERDNRRENLRAVTHRQNLQNQKGPHRKNRSGVRGVTWNKDHNKWAAIVVDGGLRHYLGFFESVEEAGKVAAAKRHELGFLTGAEQGGFR